MKFLLAITLSIIAVTFVAAGLLWATGNLDLVLTPVQNQAQQLKQRFEDSTQIVPWSADGPGYVERNTRSINPEDAVKRLGKLPVRSSYNAEAPLYDRDTWGEWDDSNRDCRNTRADILATESSKAVTYHNGCRVVNGQWHDPWNGQVYTEASEVDIDHHVPLANAHYSGGHAWDEFRKRQYYNDTDLPAALNAMSSADNRSKGAKGPERWTPHDPARHCDYATGWVAVKSKYGLSVTTNERNALAQMLSTCKASP